MQIIPYYVAISEHIHAESISYGICDSIYKTLSVYCGCTWSFRSNLISQKAKQINFCEAKDRHLDRANNRSFIAVAQIAPTFTPCIELQLQNQQILWPLLDRNFLPLTKWYRPFFVRRAVPKKCRKKRGESSTGLTFYHSYCPTGHKALFLLCTASTILRRSYSTKK